MITFRTLLLLGILKTKLETGKRDVKRQMKHAIEFYSEAGKFSLFVRGAFLW